MYRRVLAVAGSVVIGLIGAVFLASPASAHHTEVKGVPYCDTETGEWVVTWTVESFAPEGVDTYKLVELQWSPASSTVGGLALTEGEVFPHPSAVALVGEQRLPGDAGSASLGVRAKWENGFEETELRTGQVTFEGLCETPEEPGPVEFSDASTCDDLTVTATNPENGVTATVQIAITGDHVDEFVLEPGQSESVTFAAEDGLTYEASVDGEVVASGEWRNPGGCEVQVPIAFQSDCDSLTIEVTNPLEDEAIEATVVFNDESETLLTIEPGETGTVSFDAQAGTFAIVSIGDQSEEIAWTEPDGCDDGSGGGLPVTGTSTGIVIGAALALLAVGGGLFLLARRRRITFTA